jgi:dihydroanticapsin dehydrogenase
MRLKNRVAIVTGSGRGIGQETAYLFAEESAGVVVADINPETGENTVDHIRRKGGEATFIRCDISNEEDVRRMCSEAVKTFGGIDILVNNAAIFVIKGLDATVDEWQRSLTVNVIGTALCSKHAVEVMKKRGGGSIVNLSSISALIAQPQFMTYSSTKAAILQMTRNMAMDLAPHNIRANCVCPGCIMTPICYDDIEREGITMEEFLRNEGAKHLLNRVGQPREVAYAILFLASSEASFITGTALNVDGGYTVP